MYNSALAGSTAINYSRLRITVTPESDYIDRFKCFSRQSGTFRYTTVTTCKHNDIDELAPLIVNFDHFVAVEAYVFIRPSDQFVVSLGQRLRFSFHFVFTTSAAIFLLERNGEETEPPPPLSGSGNPQLMEYEFEAVAAADNGFYTFIVTGMLI